MEGREALHNLDVISIVHVIENSVWSMFLISRKVRVLLRQAVKRLSTFPPDNYYIAVQKQTTITFPIVLQQCFKLDII